MRINSFILAAIFIPKAIAIANQIATTKTSPPWCILSCVQSISRTCENHLSDISCLCEDRLNIFKCIIDVCPFGNFLPARDHYLGTCIEQLPWLKDDPNFNYQLDDPNDDCDDEGNDGGNDGGNDIDCDDDGDDDEDNYDYDYEYDYEYESDYFLQERLAREDALHMISSIDLVNSTRSYTFTTFTSYTTTLSNPIETSILDHDDNEHDDNEHDDNEHDEHEHDEHEYDHDEHEYEHDQQDEHDQQEHDQQEHDQQDEHDHEHQEHDEFDDDDWERENFDNAIDFQFATPEQRYLNEQKLTDYNNNIIKNDQQDVTNMFSRKRKSRNRGGRNRKNKPSTRAKSKGNRRSSNSNYKNQNANFQHDFNQNEHLGTERLRFSSNIFDTPGL